MLPLPVPKGTTLDTFVEEVWPAAHAAQVPSSVPSDPIVVVLSLAPDPRVYTLTVRGAVLTVTRGESRVRDLWIHGEGRAAETFIADWADGASGGVLTPRWTSSSAGPTILTDPRILRRLQQVTGRIELALVDFPGGRAALNVAAGSAAKQSIDACGAVPADAVAELTLATFAEVTAGKLRPDAAIAEGRFELRGKKMTALQFAFAVGPFFQPA